MFQKHPDGHYGVLKLENVSGKKFGKTYWGFALNSNNYQLKIYSGSGSVSDLDVETPTPLSRLGSCSR